MTLVMPKDLLVISDDRLAAMAQAPHGIAAGGIAQHFDQVGCAAALQAFVLIENVESLVGTGQSLRISFFKVADPGQGSQRPAIEHGADVVELADPFPPPVAIPPHDVQMPQGFAMVIGSESGMAATDLPMVIDGLFEQHPGPGFPAPNPMNEADGPLETPNGLGNIPVFERYLGQPVQIPDLLDNLFDTACVQLEGPPLECATHTLYHIADHSIKMYDPYSSRTG